VLCLVLVSCRQATQSISIKSNDDSVLVLGKQIDSIRHTYQVGEKEYAVLYSLADRIKPYCDNFQGSDKSKLPERYNFCAEMYRRRCYVNNRQPYTIKGCQYADKLIECCLKSIPISKSLNDTLSLNYTNSLGFLADAYIQLGKIDEALKLQLDILSKYEKMYPGMSDMPMFANYDIGKTYELKGQLKTANEYFKKVLNFQKEFQSKYLIETVDSIKLFQMRTKDLLK
jgi:tetratricopeptide (TPR) repeat protein